jgi:hypothetical protein
MEGEMSSIATKYQLRAGSVAAMLRGAMLVLAMLVGVAYAPQASAQGTTPAAETAPLSQGQLEQLVAPIALYPDDLLSQVLMASTYPLEVVQAARWASQNPGMTGKALEDGMAKQKWDPSVKGLVAVPQTLQMMSDKLDWTQQLGDAFLDDQAAVLDAVQRLRQRAEGAGNLQTTPQQKVVKLSQPGPTGQPVERIVVERADPQTVYVPVYDPGVAYGTWPYPDYPPYYYQPPGWVPGAFAYGAIGFATGAVVGAAIWGGANWWGGNVNINANRYNSFNRTNIANGNWNHNVSHRGNVPYRNSATAQRFGGQTGQGGRQGAGAGTGNRQTGAGKAGAGNRQAGAGQKGGGPRAAKQGGGNRQANRASQGAARSGNVSRGGGGMQHRGGGGMQHRAAGGMNRSMGGARGGGGMRAGGGGHRGGGGRGGGRRSDIRVKHDIALLGHLDNGLGFYRFSYNGSNKAYVGVMAQEVQAVRPAVVTRGRDGMLRVRYDMLGVKFQTYDQWIRSGAHLPITVRAY